MLFFFQGSPGSISACWGSGSAEGVNCISTSAAVDGRAIAFSATAWQSSGCSCSVSCSAGRVAATTNRMATLLPALIVHAVAALLVVSHISRIKVQMFWFVHDLESSCGSQEENQETQHNSRSVRLCSGNLI